MKTINCVGGPLDRHLNRGFAGRPPELKWLLTSPIFSGFSRFSRHFEGQRYRTFYSKNHRHYCDLNANQVCYTFRYVLSYFHNENELTELKRLISGRNSIFVYLKLQYTFDLTGGRLHTVDMVKITYKLIIMSHANPRCDQLSLRM